ncbi:helix-turn-helix domain-containing protein [Rheinheimera texasensis]|uniref:AraC family transcriptional regulator n=1 Tax=Rheinheimera texasensis TaxID=306205 RepID=UPI0032B288E4
MLHDHLLFFFSALGAFNGVTLALYLWLTGTSALAQRALAVLILMVSVRTGKSVAFYFLPDTPAPVMQAGLTACLLIGPALYFYTRASLTPTLGRIEVWHASALGVIALALNLLWPYAAHASVWHGPIVSTVNWLWLGYLLASTALLLQQRRCLPSGNARWLLFAVHGGLWLIWLAYFTSGFTSYIVGALSFSFVLYLCVAIGWAWRQGQAPVEPYQDRRIPGAEAEAELQALADLMAREKLYLDPALTLARLARRCGLPQARLSQLLNDNNGTSFKQYIALLRVGETQRLLLEQPGQTLEAIAEAAGFQSLSTFYAAFKKANACTPAAFRERHLTTKTAFSSTETADKTVG